MRRRGFFTKILAGTFGAAAGAGASRGSRAADPGAGARLVWREDVFDADLNRFSYITSRPVCAGSLVVLLNGIALLRGDSLDYLACGHDVDGKYVSVKMNFGVQRQGDKVVLRYQTWEESP